MYRMIPKEEEMNRNYRECFICGKYTSLLGTINELGAVRDYNVSPGNKGLCTCQESITLVETSNRQKK